MFEPTSLRPEPARQGWGDDIACAVRQAVFTRVLWAGEGVIAYAVLQCMPQPALLHQQHGQSQNDISAETLHALRCTVIWQALYPGDVSEF